MLHPGKIFLQESSKLKYVLPIRIKFTTYRFYYCIICGWLLTPLAFSRALHISFNIKWIKRISIVFLFLNTSSFFFNSVAQQPENKIAPDQYRAVHWTMENGLSIDGMNTMIKDANGFVWFGSIYGGFCRFDGATFKKFLPDPSDRNTINSDKIMSFKEDSLKNIWIGTDKGLSRYDIKADTFTNFSPYAVPPSAPFDIAPFWATKNEIFCMEPGGLITAFNIHTLKRIKLVQLSKKVDHRIHWNSNKSFFDLQSKSIWKLGYYGQDQARLEQIFLDGTTQLFSWPCYRGNINHRHSAEDIRYDPKRNCIWVNSGEGLLEFSLHDKKFRKILALDDLVNTKDYNRGVGVDIDRNNRIWFSTFYNGIYLYDPQTDVARPLFSDPALQKKSGDANLHIYCDRDGITWTSDWLGYGINEILPYNPPVQRYTANPQKKDSLSNQSIHSIIPASNGEVWIGTEDGLNIFDTKSDKLRVLRQNDLPGLKGKFIVPVHIDTISKKAWISSSTSTNTADIDLYEMDLETKRCKPIVFRESAKLLDTFSISTYCYRPYQKGLLIADESHGIFEIKENSKFADLVISFKSAIGRMELIEDRFIFLQRGQHLPNFSYENKNGKWIKTSHLLDSLEWQSMFYNKKDQTFWVGFKYKLVHYDKSFRELNTYRQEDGYNGTAHNMLTDINGNLWFTNNLHQVNRLDTTIGVITNISENDGYQKQVHVWFTPAAKDEKGNLYFGSNNYGSNKINGGLDRIYPERYSSTSTSSVYLRALTINHKPFPLSIGINNLEELSLRYNQNTISIETGIIDFYANGKGHLRYKLIVNEKEEDWQYAPAYYTLRFEGLPAGSYKLIMQASNAGNEFNSPEKILSFKIIPPFWKTWWFRVAAVIFVLGLFYAITRWRLKEKFRIQLERSEKERQVVELKQKATQLEMQALRAQMNPHFIFNSLNSINRFILQNNRQQASGYLTKFSKLVRLILQNSQASLIPLESELESLEIYLNLEALRFNYHFDYKISYSKEIDISALQVPPLILQPYVENAIWHGLMHKEEKGLLDIEITEEQDHLCFRISDNGIGRKKAAALASKSATKHKSMGLRITANRIAMIQQSPSVESPVTIHDLVNADGSAAGTEVVIKMPVIYD